MTDFLSVNYVFLTFFSGSRKFGGFDMVKEKPNSIRTYDEEGYRRRAACLCFKDETEQEVNVNIILGLPWGCKIYNMHQHLFSEYLDSEIDRKRVSSVVSALASSARGLGFDPPHSRQEKVSLSELILSFAERTLDML